MLDLRHLRHVVTLDDERHFARAAERVHLSQPAFSRSIQAIERQLELRLFDRDSGEVRPTAAGEFMIARARQLLFDARCLARDAALYRDSQLGDAAFGAGPFPAVTFLPQVLARMKQEHPQVALRVDIDNWSLLLERLHAEDIEFFVSDVRDLPADDDALDVQSLGRQRGGFYVRKGHPLAGRSCGFAKLWSCGVASTRLPRAVQGVFARLLGLPAGAEPRPALECDDVSMLKAVVLATDLVLASTDAAVLADLASGALKPVRVKDLPTVAAEMGVVRLRQRTPSPMAQQVIECIREVAATVNE
jgi:DNA-binding transcriptional LysR family regulator